MMISFQTDDIHLQLKTAPGLFSPGNPDTGTLAMLSCASFTSEDKVLDLGCGYGLVGIYIAKIIGGQHVTMSDIDESAVRLAKENTVVNDTPDITILLSDGFTNIPDSGYTLILSNPPYHSDFRIAKHFIEKGFNRLVIGGKMLMVTKRKEWYKNKFTAVFGGVQIREINGYTIFIAEKRQSRYANSL